MRISELQELLEIAKEDYGDVEVTIDDGSNLIKIEEIEYSRLEDCIILLAF